MASGFRGVGSFETVTFRTVGTMISPQRKGVAAVGGAKPGDVLGTEETFPSLVAGLLKRWSFGSIRSDY